MGVFANQLKAFAVETGDRMDAVTTGAVKEAGHRLIAKSPVLTGQFADNWTYGLEAPDTRTHGPDGRRAINNLEELPRKSAGHIHFLTNALPYGPALERGHSKQAPQGMVGLTVQEWSDIVDLAVRRAKR